MENYKQQVLQLLQKVGSNEVELSDGVKLKCDVNQKLSLSHFDFLTLEDEVKGEDEFTNSNWLNIIEDLEYAENNL